MLYLEIILAWGSALLSLILSSYNLFKKLRSAANITLSLACLTAAGLFSLIGLNLLDPALIPTGSVQRLILSLLLLVAVLVACFFFLFPFVKKRGLVLAAAAGIPGYALCAVTIATDLIVSRSADDPGMNILSDGYPFYLAGITCYIVLTIIIIIIKAGRLENRAQRNDLVYLVISLSLLFSAFLAVSLYLPYLAGINQFSTLAILIVVPAILVILNYSAIDIVRKDLRIFFATALYWLLILSLLCGPTVLIMHYNTAEYLKEPAPPLGIALLLFVYLFLVFKFLSPRIEKFSRRGYQSRVALVDGLFSTLLSPESREGKSWEEHLVALVDGLVEKFQIGHAHLYLYGRKEKKFSVIHNSVTNASDAEISLASPLAELFGRFPAILYKPSIYSEAGFSQYRDAVLEYLERNRVEVVMPFMDQEGKTIGLLAMGPLENNMIYSKSLLSVLELFRIQFQQHLANSLMLDQVRATQVIDHDQMVVSNVKKKIIPQKMHQTNRFQISSFYINNSTYGGDYFDSVALGEERAALFMSDSSYSGVDSAVISLELYTVLHTPSKSFETPDRILATMNWVLSTSRFSNKHASAYCAVLSSNGDVSFSNAAFNPMMVYGPGSETFTACDTGGVPVGADRTSKYGSKTVRMVPGSIGILYSDGLVSALNERGDVYGFARVKEIIRTGKTKSPSDLTRSVYEDYNQFIRGKNQINDVSVIIFKFQ